MQALTVRASTLDVAHSLYSALAAFHPEVTECEAGGYLVTVSLHGSDRRVIEILDALEQHVAERDAGPARVELDGRMYTMHA